MKLSRYLSLGALSAALLIAADVAFAQQQTPPQVQQIGPNDLFPEIPNGYGTPGTYYASSKLLGNYAQTQSGNNPDNALIGGDFGKNLFQDGASVGSITTAVTYVADGWTAFSGTSTTLAGAQETAAPDIPQNYNGALRITRSGTGVVQSCVAQEISTADSVRFQGQTAEVDFHALAGSGFSSANSVLSVLLVQGTGTDEGTVNLGKTINSALTGSAWTGATTETVNETLTTGWNRFSAVFPVATTTTEIAVALCYTPVGASPSSDYFDFTGAQLVTNSSLTTVAGSAGAALGVNDYRAKSFARKPAAIEYNLQYAQYYRINEVAGAYYASGAVTATNVESAVLPLPMPMRILPSCTFTAGGLKWDIAGTQTSVGTLACTAAKNTPNVVTVTDTTTGTAGGTALLDGSSTTGAIKVSARL